jgi:AraC-like DNA-binding protein
MVCLNLLPSPALNEFVRNYKILHLKFNSNNSIPFKHRPPKPEQGMVFYIKGGLNLQNLNNGNSQIPAPVSIFSHQTDKKRLEISTEFYILAIFLRPGILHRLINVPMAELNDNYLDAELFFGTEVRRITEQLESADHYTSMIPIVESFLLEKFRQMRSWNAIDDIANTLLADPTKFSLDAIANEACLSPKQFYRKFVQRIGISPKFYSRIIRFNQAFQYKINSSPGLLVFHCPGVFLHRLPPLRKGIQRIYRVNA